MHIFLNVAAAIEVARKAVAYTRAHHGGGMVNVSGFEAVVIRADITDPAAVAAMFERINALPPAN